MPRALRAILLIVVVALAAGAGRQVHLVVDHAPVRLSDPASALREQASTPGPQGRSGCHDAGERGEREHCPAPGPDRDEHHQSCDLCQWLGGSRADALHLSPIPFLFPEASRLADELPVAEPSSRSIWRARARAPPPA